MSGQLCKTGNIIIIIISIIIIIIIMVTCGSQRRKLPHMATHAVSAGDLQIAIIIRGALKVFWLY